MATHFPKLANLLYRNRMLLAIGVVAAVVLVNGRTASAEEKTVKLVIEFGDGAKTKQFEQIAWKEKMTVLDAMNAVKDKTPGIKFDYRGQGRTALLTSIDEIKNEGAEGLNWIFDVNGKLAERGFGVLILKANDVVTWKFGKYP